MKKREHPKSATEEIRGIPVIYLLNFEMEALNELERKLKEELQRTQLAIKWIKGIKQIKLASKDGGANG